MFVSRKTVLPGVGAINVFAAEGHRWIRQPALQNRQRIHDAVASVAGLLSKRLLYNRITFAVRFETRVWSRLHQLFLINDIRFGVPEASGVGAHLNHLVGSGKFAR